MSLRVEVAGKSDVGCVRSNNEDSFGFDRRHGVYVVSDGMGGMAAGEVASKIAVETVLRYFREQKANGSHREYGTQQEGLSPRANALGSAIQLANAAILQAALSHAAHSGMGATIVAVHVEDGAYSVAHVGDSRVYLVRDKKIQQLTDDHSLVMEQVRRGLITPEQAKYSEVQNIIIRALGTEETVDVDLTDMTAVAGDTLLLCSDGLTRHVEDDELLAVISGSSDLDAACDNLIEVARERGGDDNITALLIRFQEKSVLEKLLGVAGKKRQQP